jgi:hypothetical protein
MKNGRKNEKKGLTRPQRRPSQRAICEKVRKNQKKRGIFGHFCNVRNRNLHIKIQFFISIQAKKARIFNFSPLKMTARKILIQRTHCHPATATAGITNRQIKIRREKKKKKKLS